MTTLYLLIIDVMLYHFCLLFLNWRERWKFLWGGRWNLVIPVWMAI